MNEDREQAFDDFLETRAWGAAQQALFDALRAAFLAGWAAAPCLPLTREVANPKGLTKGEIHRACAKRNAKSLPIANSLPQSPAATAPSSEGAKGAGIFPAGQLLRRSKGGLGWSLPGGFFI